MSEKRRRKHYSAEQKVRIVRLHLLEGRPISDLSDEFGINPTQYFRWQKTFFENGQAAFNCADGRKAKRAEDAKDKKIAKFEEKIQAKNEVIAELMQEHVQLKKELGEP